MDKPIDEMTLEELEALNMTLTASRMEARTAGQREEVLRIRVVQLEVNDAMTRRMLDRNEARGAAPQAQAVSVRGVPSAERFGFQKRGV